MGIWWSILLLAGGLLAWPSLTAAQSGFDPIVNVSQTPTDSRMPHMAMDDTGTLHLAWTDDFRIFYKRSEDRGQSFSPPLRVSGGSAAALRPRLAVHGSTVHLVWTQDPDNATSSEMKEVMYSRSLDGGVTFTAPVNLSNSPGQSQEARVAVDSAGTVFVAWDEASPARHLVLRRSSDGGASFQATRMPLRRRHGRLPARLPQRRLHHLSRAGGESHDGASLRRLARPGRPGSSRCSSVARSTAARRSPRRATSRTGRSTPIARRSPWARPAASWSPGRTGRTPSTTSTTPSSPVHRRGPNVQRAGEPLQRSALGAVRLPLARGGAGRPDRRGLGGQSRGRWPRYRAGPLHRRRPDLRAASEPLEQPRQRPRPRW